MRKVLAIVAKDITSELRSRDVFLSVLFFAFLVVVIFNFAFDPDDDTSSLVAPGVLWSAYTFAGVVGLGRVFAIEKEKGCIEGLMLCPVDRDIIYWGKAATSFILMFVVELVVTPVFLVMYDLPLFMPELLLIVLLATIGFVSVGTLFSALALNLRARDVLLPVLFFPMVVPVVISAVESTEVVFQGEAFSEMTSWLGIMAAFDAVFLAVSAMVFGFVVEE